MEISTNFNPKLAKTKQKLANSFCVMFFFVSISTKRSGMEKTRKQKKEKDRSVIKERKRMSSVTAAGVELSEEKKTD
jgi:hypothetical protein